MKNDKNDKCKVSLESGDLLKGVLIGVAAALAIGGLVALFTTRHRYHRDGMRPEKRLANYNPEDDALGDVPSQFEESGGSVVDTIRAVNQALETGRQAMETIHNVMENIRGS